MTVGKTRSGVVVRTVDSWSVLACALVATATTSEVDIGALMSESHGVRSYGCVALPALCVLISIA